MLNICRTTTRGSSRPKRAPSGGFQQQMTSARGILSRPPGVSTPGGLRHSIFSHTAPTPALLGQDSWAPALRLLHPRARYRQGTPISRGQIKHRTPTGSTDFTSTTAVHDLPSQQADRRSDKRARCFQADWCARQDRPVAEEWEANHTRALDECAVGGALPASKLGSYDQRLKPTLYRGWEERSPAPGRSPGGPPSLGAESPAAVMG